MDDQEATDRISEDDGGLTVIKFVLKAAVVAWAIAIIAAFALIVFLGIVYHGRPN